MMKNIAVITTAFGNGLKDRQKYYDSLAKELRLNIWYCTKEELLLKPNGIEGVIVGVEKADENLFKCGDLKVAMKFGVGLDNFDMASAEKFNVKVTNMPGINSDAVAEMTFTLMLGVSRLIHPMANHLAKGEFVQYCSNSILGKTIGIIGMGTIGQKVAKIAKAFGMKCLGYDIQPITIENVSMVDLKTIYSESDVISLHIPLIESTHHLIDAKAFAMMKDQAILVNTSRGGIVDDYALYKHLKENKILGAGLDVFEDEEIMEKLAKLNNTICTPHVAAYTHETLRYMEDTALRKMKSCLVD